MTDRWLQEILNIDGVRGVYIASGRGNVIEKLGIDEKDAVLEQLTVHVLRILSGYHLRSLTITEIEFYWQDQYVICRYTNNMLLVILCKTPKVLSLLRITLNVALANLLEDKKLTKAIKDQTADKTYHINKGELDENEVRLINKLR
ncbi:MAG: hypothetical protein AB7W47_03670 [Calditrichaceae bacterium]